MNAFSGSWRGLIIAILFIVLIGVAIQNHGTSLELPVLAADSNCHFLNDKNGTYDRTSHLNSYNVCITADYMDRVVAKRPYPQTKITDSLERQQLTEKLLRFNDPNKIGYVTLLSDYGTVIATYTVKGKVSSNQSSLTATVQYSTVEAGNNMAAVPSPGDDGSYGENEPGIFFFTTEGVMKQWNGKYLYSDAPQQVSTAPIITYNVADKPSTAYDIGK